MKTLLTPEHALPEDLDLALLIVKVFVPGKGAVLGKMTKDVVIDLSRIAKTSSELFELDDLVERVKSCSEPVLCATREVLANSHHKYKNHNLPYLMAPNDLQAIKAAGVTFVQSMLERVIEEQARGDASKPRQSCARLSVCVATQASPHQGRDVVSVLGGRYRRGCRNIYQITTHECSRYRRGDWHSPKE